jgi:hypothetical protein
VVQFLGDDPSDFSTWNISPVSNVQSFREKEISAMFAFLLWCILFVLCWPLALLALVAYPFVWLLLLPFRIVGVAVHGVLEVIFLAITLPFRLLAAPFRI